MRSCLTPFGCFTHWWMALPAVPDDRECLDWWAKADGGCCRYRRLKRLWFDNTRLLAPKHDPHRPQEFGKPNHSTHLIPKVWEKVDRTDKRWGVLTWSKLQSLQIAAVEATLPEPVTGFITAVIADCFTVLRRGGPVLSDGTLEGIGRGLLGVGGLPPHIE